MSQALHLQSASTSLQLADLESLLHVIENTADATGIDYFRTLVEHLARVIGARHSFVAEFVQPSRVRTLAYWSDGAIVPNIEYDLAETPCREVIDGNFCFYPSGLHTHYPITEKGIESYLGCPLKTRDGRILGHLCAFDESPIADDPHRLSIFKVVAARAAAEFHRMHLEQELRDLFDEAPIAYVHEDLDSRFIRANAAARRILGITEEDVVGMVGKTLVADTPEAQQRVTEAFESVGHGTDTSGVVLEMRRKDNGKPTWIQWWSKPDSSGTYTRTMFVDITDRVLLEREQARLKAQYAYLQEELKSVHNFEEIVGASRALTKVLRQVELVAPTDATVLITGETGTGKELIARAIHSASSRASKPFIKINCAALPASLVESELFGHERGAFSGAVARRVGRFELANTGTIFLDEVGEVPLEVQVKLLRVLQEREFERVGSSQTIKTDVRVIAATNRDMQTGIQNGDFRADLFFRLNVFPVELPPLRARKEDIPLLAHFFVQKYSPRVGRRIDAIDPDAMQRLVTYSWPGNIRELENIIERALILTTGTELQIDPDMLPRDSAPLTAPVGSQAAAQSTDAPSGLDLDSIQREHIVAVLTESNWVIEGSRGAATRLGLKPGTLRHRMKKLGIARHIAHG